MTFFLLLFQASLTFLWDFLSAAPLDIAERSDSIDKLPRSMLWDVILHEWILEIPSCVIFWSDYISHIQEAHMLKKIIT